MQTIYKKEEKDWSKIFSIFFAFIMIVVMPSVLVYEGIKHGKPLVYICVDNNLYYKNSEGTYVAVLKEHYIEHDELVHCVNKPS